MACYTTASNAQMQYYVNLSYKTWFLGLSGSGNSTVLNVVMSVNMSVLHRILCFLLYRVQVWINKL